jgi:hypothetical protein
VSGSGDFVACLQLLDWGRTIAVHVNGDNSIVLSLFGDLGRYGEWGKRVIRCGPLTMESLKVVPKIWTEATWDNGAEIGVRCNTSFTASKVGLKMD